MLKHPWITGESVKEDLPEYGEQKLAQTMKTESQISIDPSKDLSSK